VSILNSKILKNDEGYEYLLGPKPSQDAIKELLKNWCREGLEEDKKKNKKVATHFLVVKNTSANMNFPVFIYDKVDLKTIGQKFHKKNDYLVIAIYDLNDKRNQDKDKEPIS
jgi:hypothetical protein